MIFFYISKSLLINQSMFSSANRLSMLSYKISKHFSNVKQIQNVDITSNGALVKVVLNKPKALNSLSTQMVTDIGHQIDFFQTHKALWMQGAGGKAFCAGGDVKALFVNGAGLADRINFFSRQFRMDYRISQMKTIQIANWDGIVMGGGVGISAFAPFIIATQNSMYAMPEGKIGFFTDVGAGYFLSRLRNNIGYYLGLTGARLKGEDVYIAGLANFFIPRENVQQAYQQINNGLSTANNAKQFIHQTLSKYHKPSGRKSIPNQDDIKTIFSKSSIQQIYQTVKSSDNPFYQQVLKLLEEQCPFSTHVTHRSISLSKNRSLKECFLQDFVLAQHFSVNQNFSEGVRCLLIDKGDTPKFTHKHLLDVKEEQVETVFKPPQNEVQLGI